MPKYEAFDDIQKVNDDIMFLEKSQALTTQAQVFWKAPPKTVICQPLVPLEILILT